MTTQLISSDIFQTWMSTINSIITDTGDKSSLSTTDKTNLVAAINEVLADLGDIAALSTTDKTNSVAAINEVLADLGDIAALSTTDKTNLVAAINEVLADLGDIAALSTTDKTNAVLAINEVLAVTTDITTNKIQLQNKEVNGGRASTSEDLDSVVVTTYTLPSTIQPFNASTGIQYGVGKFVNDNSTNGGAGAALEAEISIFLTDTARSELRYGTEYFLSTIEAGSGVTELLDDGGDLYYAMTSNNMKYLGQIGDIITWSGWVKFITVGDAPSLGKIVIGNNTNVTSWIDNVLQTDYTVIAAVGNWFHVRQQITLTKEFENIFPAIYGNFGTTTGDLIGIGLPTLFNGDIEVTKEKHIGIFG